MEQDVLAVIRSRMERMSPRRRQIARFYLENAREAVFLPAAQVGERLGLSESTLVRFAQFLGYSGYPAFRQALEAPLRRSWELEEAQTGGEAQTVETLEGEGRRISAMAASLSGEALERGWDILLHARRVYIMGLGDSGPLSLYLYNVLSGLRPGAVHLTGPSQRDIIEQMFSISEEDAFVGLAFPPYSVRTLKAMELANDRRARVISISDGACSPMHLYSSCNLSAPWPKRRAEGFWVAPLAAPMALLQVWLLSLVQSHGEAFEARWGELTDVLEDYQAQGPDALEWGPGRGGV